ncbi:MAG: prepilin-type N-terminal cleavage/methylation domain-containing protein [Acidobacteriota bacterium]
MRALSTRKVPKKKTVRGFSIIELLLVVALVSVVAAFSIPAATEAARYQQAETSLETVKMQMRLARQFSIDQRRVHRVTFLVPRTVTLERLDSTGTVWTLLSSIALAGEIEFRLEPGVVASGEGTPDGFSTTSPINFNDAGEIFFRPDGSAVDALGRISNGIAHLSLAGSMKTARAVTLFGSTGRIKGWRFERNPDSSWGWN